MLAAHFSRFFEANPGFLHFGAHSHHPWPDATESAQRQYWSDAATRVDRKWEKVFGEVVPAAQAHVARLLSLGDARQVAFAPNTHEFVARLYSCLDYSRPVRVLTSAHEFHSFRRQTLRLEETGRVAVTNIPAEPYETFSARFEAAARAGEWDLVWLSHVFFDSGFVVPGLERIVDAVSPSKVDAVSPSGVDAVSPSGVDAVSPSLGRGQGEGPIVVIDGYHAFCALPVDLSAIHQRAFYIAGGYKYAMSGEGACFLCVPPGSEQRPVDTGWFASFETLSGPAPARVPYSEGAMRFWGSTFDPSGLYRFRAAMDWLVSTGTSVADVHAHALRLQARFLAGAGKLAASLVPPAGIGRGNFLTFDVEDAEALHQRITDAGVYIDRRARRLRFGFGVYQDEAMVDQLLTRLVPILR